MDLISLITLLIMITNTLPLVSSSGCSISKCGDHGNPDIRFPFQFNNSKQPDLSCGYPGFNVSCDVSQKQTLVELQNSESFNVKNIDYAAQEIWVNDPNNCLPKRLLTLNLSSSPFSGVYFQDFSFFNCSKIILSQNTPVEGIVGPISCLSGSHYFVFAIPTNSSVTNNGNHSIWLSSSNCSSIADRIKVPIQRPMTLYNQVGKDSLDQDLRLAWFMPECQSCELKDQMCGLNISSNGPPVIACWNILNQGTLRKLSLSTYIAILLVICAPSIICLVGSLFIWVRSCNRRNRNHDTDHPSILTPRHGHMTDLGLEEAGIDFARELVLLGLNNGPHLEIRSKIIVTQFEIAGPIEKNTCPICMSEYQPKDKIGTLPICSHSFHDSCIRKWVHSRSLIEKTCPICRARVVS